MENKIEFLNKIYTTLSENASRLSSGLNSSGYECNWEWKENPTSEDRSYPLPVIEISKLGALIVDVDVNVLDIELSRKKLLSLNVKKAAEKRRIEIYAFDNSTIAPILKYDEDTSVILPFLMSNAYEKFRLRVRLDKNTDVMDIKALFADFSDKKV